MQIRAAISGERRAIRGAAYTGVDGHCTDHAAVPPLLIPRAGGAALQAGDPGDPAARGGRGS